MSLSLPLSKAVLFWLLLIAAVGMRVFGVLIWDEHLDPFALSFWVGCMDEKAADGRLPIFDDRILRQFYAVARLPMLCSGTNFQSWSSQVIGLETISHC